MLMLKTLCLFLLFPGVVRTPTNDLPSVVKQIERHYRAVKTLRAEFIQRWSDSPASVRLESGIVSIRRPREMRWEYREPESKVFISDGRTVYFYVPADQTVRRSLLRDSADWRAPLAWLAGSARLGKLFSKIEWAASPRPVHGKPVQGEPFEKNSQDKPGRGYALCGLPRSPDDGFTEAILEFSDGYQLTRLLIRDTVGREVEFRFGEWEENLPLPAQEFRFVVPAGVAVVDEADLAGAR